MSATQASINESDFESPGYEYLRSYQNMSNLYYKLVTLNYHKEFCSRYKCPAIHKYYFSVPDKNMAEQRFLFACLCAWLIKDKCQMNLELEPEEYEDPDLVIGVIFEALRLLVNYDEESGTKRESKSSISFPPGRLKNGFGPEVIWTMNVLADRALEIMLDTGTFKTSETIISYVNKANNLSDQSRPPTTSPNSIFIGQPSVGGGLTTRPLGSYQVDDKSLLFDDDVDQSASENSTDNSRTEIEMEDWYREVARSVHSLESAHLVDDKNISEDWQDYTLTIEKAQKNIEDFLTNSKPVLDAVTNRIDRQLQVLHGREKFIQSNLRPQIENFLKAWRDNYNETKRHNTLLERVNSKTDQFDEYNSRLKSINIQIETRIKELNDGRKLKELEALTDQLKKESADFQLKIGLLLTVYSKIQANIVSNSLNQ